MEIKEKEEAIKKMKEKAEKDFGKGTVMSLSEKPDFNQDNVISTGSLTLDIALGIGGLPKGRIVEIYGPESSGKTTIAIHVMAEAQKKGGYVGFIDAEHAFDKEYARNLGVDVDSLIINQPDYGEQGLEVADRMIATGAFDVIVIDSVAALIPKKELDGEMGDSSMGLHARLMSQACRKLAGTIAKSNTLVIFINQLRDKIGVMFGSPETTTGGNALKFYASIRLDVRRQTGQTVLIKGDNDEFIGNPVTVKVVKSKVSPPFKKANFSILFGQGINRQEEVITCAVDLGIIKKSGSWFSYEDTKIGQGYESVISLLRDNEELGKEIEDKVLVLLGKKIIDVNKNEDL